MPLSHSLPLSLLLIFSMFLGLPQSSAFSPSLLPSLRPRPAARSTPVCLSPLPPLSSAPPLPLSLRPSCLKSSLQWLPLHPRHLHHFSLGPLYASSDKEAEGEGEEEEQEIVVRDKDTGKSIECYVDEHMLLDGKEYVLAYPCDRPVVIARIEGEGEEEELLPVEEEEIGGIFEQAYKACAMCDAELIDSAVVLTLQGDLEEDEEEEEMLENMGDVEDDEEFVKVLTSFYDTEGVEFLVTEPIEPVIIIAKPTSGAKPTKGKNKRDLYELLSNEELDGVMPSVEGILEERYNEE